MSYNLYILALRSTINKKKIPQKNTQRNIYQQLHD